MDNITSGHWIFAGLFALVFVGVLVWSYRRDSSSHKPHYSGTIQIVLALMVALFLLFIFKRI